MRIARNLLIALVVAVPALHAQDPTKLPTVRITADAHSLVGIVTDTSGIPIPDAQVTIPKLRRLIASGPDGSFRFDTVPPGMYDVRARKIGYGPQIQQIKFGKDGGRLDNFELVPITRLLPAVVAAVERLGLSGIVADTSFAGLPGAGVKVLGAGMATVTDSVGAFYVPIIRPGNYLATVSKDGYDERMVGFTIPADSGRRITVSLGPPRAHSHLQVQTIAKLKDAAAWAEPGSHFMYGHDYLAQKGFVWLQDALADMEHNYGMSDPTDDRCFATLNGDPDVHARIRDLTIDEVESFQIFGPSQIRGASRAAGKPVSSIKTPPAHSVGINSGLRCLPVVVWTR
jgi:hypothetical protein